MHVLIISCSRKKKQDGSQHKIFDLYMGDMFKMIRKNSPNFNSHFHLIIMSAEFGLVSSRDENKFGSYNNRLSNNKDINNYIKYHGFNSAFLLNQLLKENNKIKVILPKKYRVALISSLIENHVPLENINCKHYLGIGYMKQDLKNYLKRKSTEKFG